MKSAELINEERQRLFDALEKLKPTRYTSTNHAIDANSEKLAEIARKKEKLDNLLRDNDI